MTNGTTQNAQDINFTSDLNSHSQMEWDIISRVELEELTIEQLDEYIDYANGLLCYPVNADLCKTRKH